MSVLFRSESTTVLDDMGPMAKRGQILQVSHCKWASHQADLEWLVIEGQFLSGASALMHIILPAAQLL